ncbi:gp14 [Synechococcus phage Syn5]|uniref:Gp14 n=1 Tax=Synechococcus phage Syn5 TaxID=2914003 RepID=A4ZR95_9CAUD|nr:gp14 [Synechococcus phage Syn5]ABP87921.1 gp14 [Synechococcus phage Syn5]
MFTRLVAVLGAITITAAAPVSALPIPSRTLLQQFEAKGGRVYVNSEQCNNKLAFGWYVNGTIHICEDNHLGDDAELADTVRHEVWHAVQACNRGPIMYDLDAEVGEAVRRGWLPISYPRHQWETEAEARNAAFNYSETEIAGFLNTYCN